MVSALSALKRSKGSLSRFLVGETGRLQTPGIGTTLVSNTRIETPKPKQEVAGKSLLDDLRQIASVDQDTRRSHSTGTQTHHHDPTSTRHIMVVRSRSSLRRPTLRGDQKSKSPTPSLSEPQQQVREESTKRARISSLTDHDRFQKRRKTTNNLKSPQVQIPLRGRLPPKLVSPKIVTQSVLLPIQSQILSPLESPKTQYDQIKIIEERARVAIRGGGLSSAGDEKRSLRSQDGGSRSKSELAQYFHHYEQMLSLEPAASDQLTAQTHILLIDDTPGFQPRSPESPRPTSDPFGASKSVHDAQRIDLSQYATNVRRYSADPLGPEVFLRIHKKEERRAKQIRNSEREKAQHEKVQLERLLDELKGPDWLRTMGISGITETEKKKYEPKRALFIEEIKTIIDKFRQLKELEKEQKKKEVEASVEEDEDTVEEDNEDEDEDEDEEVEEDADADDEDEEQEQSSLMTSTGRDVPDSSDVDAMAARQLMQEANSADKPRKKVVEPPLPPLEPPPHKPFTSFYDKRHVRDAAIGKHGRRSRGVSAFGQPVPEMEERWFELPESILTEDAIRAGQRRRRRINRENE